jgi:hypothetical protein
MATGLESEATLRANRPVLQGFRLKPRRLVDAGKGR